MGADGGVERMKACAQVAWGGKRGTVYGAGLGGVQALVAVAFM